MGSTNTFTKPKIWKQWETSTIASSTFYSEKHGGKTAKESYEKSERDISTNSQYADESM